MAKKKSKLATPNWIKKGYDSPEAYNKSKGIKSEKKKSGRTFKVRKCPECNSENVNVVLVGEEGKNIGEWECKKCNWRGIDIKEEKLGEEEFLKHLDEKGEGVA